MQDLARGVRKQIIKETTPKVAAKKSFTMRRLRRAALWGVTAAGAVLIAVLSSRGQLGAQRLADVLHGSRVQLATPAFDAEAETQRLARAVRGLAADTEQMKSRLAAVEHGMDDVTGSIGKQIEAANAARRGEAGPTVTGTASVAAAMMTAAPPPPAIAFPPVRSAPASSQGPPAAAAPAALATAYGADIGSGLTIQALRARWAAIRAAHPELFEGLQPIVSIKDVPRANRIELRLLAGPFAAAGAAAQFCAALTPFGLFCQPTMFDGQRLALR